MEGQLVLLESERQDAEAIESYTWIATEAGNDVSRTFLTIPTRVGRVCDIPSFNIELLW